MESGVMFYGERGIVNSILLDIYDGKLDLSDMLKSMHYLSGAPSELRQEIESVLYVPEASFGDWGNPDLMIKVKYKSGKTIYYIIEAKVKPFSQECAEKEGKYFSYTGKSGSRNCASLINIQLGLRCRFMQKWKNREKGSYVEEKQHNKVLDGEKYKNGRALKKRYTIDFLQGFLEDVEYGDDSDIPDNVYYVALVTEYVLTTENGVEGDKKYFKGLFTDEKANNKFISHAGFLTYDVFRNKGCSHFDKAFGYINNN